MKSLDSRFRFKLIALFILIGMVLSIVIVSNDTIWIEENYSKHYFVLLAQCQRMITGKLPFSIGDLLYGLVVFYLIIILIRFIKKIFKRQLLKQELKSIFIDSLLMICVVYIVFNLFWGLNYNRRGIASQLNIEVGNYSVSDLINLNKVLVADLNASREILNHSLFYNKKDQVIFHETQLAYENVGKKYTFLKYDHPSVKKSMWGWFGNYAGFTGYYNPFTGEAQVNTSIPVFLQPFVCCHEMAHQLGYAKEKEANFVAYLTALHSTDTLLKYSAYFEMFLYANRNLQNVDSVTAKSYRNKLSDKVKSDIRQLVLFQKKHRSPIEPVVSTFYEFFLRNNQQPNGLQSYDEVVGLLIAYHNKYPK